MIMRRRYYYIIKSSICYDFGIIYNDSISGGAAIAFAFRNTITYKNPNRISTIDSKKDAYVADLKEIMYRFAE